MPPLSDSVDDERFIRYLRGECSSDEVDVIERWADATPGRRRQLDLLRRAWAASGARVLRGDVDKGWAAIAAHLDKPIEPRVPHEHVSRVLRFVPALRTRPRLLLAACAAGTALAVGATGLFVWMTGQRGSSEQASMMREITTRPGQRTDVYLTDGTHVVLSVASRLRFPAGFGASRDVELDGQAYFDVAHDARPFAVHAARVVVRDVGTKFDVRAYARSENVVVAVTEGSVVLKSASDAQVRTDSVVLKQSDVGVVSPDGTFSVRDDANVGAYAAWTTGELVFQHAPVSEVVAQLNRWYGANIQLGDSTLAGLALTMSITNESLPETVRIMAYALDARIEAHGTAVVLYARKTH